MNEALQVQKGRSGAEPVVAVSRKEEVAGPLLPRDFVEDLRTRWDRIQTTFVDEPRVAVQQADELVASGIKRLSESFTEARNNLERQWDHGEEADTEELRIALKKYRAFFQRILAI